MLVADRIIGGYEFDPHEMAAADLHKATLIVGILTVHSFPEGVALGVAFADLGVAGNLDVAGFAIPILAIFITLAISIQNIPEGLAVGIPLKTFGLSNARLLG